jgi:hypothetical protein
MLTVVCLPAAAAGKTKETSAGIVQRADEAVEVAAEKVEGTLRGVAGAAKSAVDSILGRQHAGARRPEE